MRMLAVVSLIIFIVSCSIAPTSKRGSDKEKDFVLNNLKASKNSHRAIYFYRDDENFGSFNVAIYINKKWVASILGDSFTRIELPYGKYFIEGSFTAEPATESKAYKKGEKSVKEMIQKLQTREFVITEKTPDPIMMRIDAEFIDPPEEKGASQYPNIFKHKIEYGEAAVKNYIHKAEYNLAAKDLNFDSWVTEKDKEDWALYSETKSVKSLDNFIRDFPHNYYVTQARIKKKKLIEIEKREFNKVRKINTLSSYSKFLEDYPTTTYRQRALKLMSSKLNNKNDYYEYADRFPDIVDYYPELMRYDLSLMSLGPRNMTIKDILKLKEEGLGDETIGAKIEATNGPFKDFSVGEIKYLKKQGITEILIGAMIKSNTEYHRQLKATRENQEMMKQIKKLIAQSQKSGAVVATTKEEKNMPIECLKLKAALKGCSATGGFLAMACEATARASFECNIKI